MSCMTELVGNWLLNISLVFPSYSCIERNIGASYDRYASITSFGDVACYVAQYPMQFENILYMYRI